jgi:hypothetical protein
MSAAAPHKGLRHRDHVLGKARDAIAPREHRIEKAVVADDLVHEAERERLVGGHGAAADEELEGLAVSHPARERPVGADLGHEADAAEGEDELRAVGRDHEVARERPGEGDTGDGAFSATTTGVSD